MGFKRTTEGRVFFKNADDASNDEVNKNYERLGDILGFDDGEDEGYEEEALELTQEIRAPRKSTSQKAPPLPSQGNAQIQLQTLTLLKTLNDKLKNSQAERKQMRKELDRYRAALENIEDQQEDGIAGRAVQAEEIARDTLKELEETRALVLKLEEKSENVDKTMTALQTLQQEQAQRTSKTTAGYAQLAKKMKEQELKQEDIVNKIEESTSQQARLVRKIDKAVEDRARFMRKIERIEETVLQTRDSLNAKAMVLLTDQGAAAHVSLEDMADNDDVSVPAALAAAQNDAQGDVVKTASAVSKWMQALTVLVVGTICLLAGWFISDVQKPEFPDLASFNIGANDNDASTVIERDGDPAVAEDIYTPLETQQANAQNWDVYEDTDAFAEQTYNDVAPNNVEPAAGASEAPAIDIGAADDIGTVQLQSDAELLKALGEEPEQVAAVLNEIEPGSQQQIIQESSAEQKALIEQQIEEKYGQAEVVPTPTVAPAAVAPASSFKIATPAGTGIPNSIKADGKLPEVVKSIEAQAFNGVAEAQHDLAAVYTAGHAGVRQNFSRGAYWFKQAADQGIANASYNLGVLNHQGLGMKANLDEAIAWYGLAAAQKHPEAQYNLGIAFIEGIGVPYNPSQAATYFEDAAGRGIKEAAYNLGLIYENGLLGRSQPEDALAWYKTAADAGSPEAKAALEQLAKSLNIKIEDVNAIAESAKADDFTSVNAPPKKKEISKAAAPAPIVAQGTEDFGQAAEVGALNPQDLAETFDGVDPALAIETPSIQEQRQILVAQIQEYLIALGLFPGPADGVAGPLMGDAIRSYQSLNNLPRDGQPSRELLGHMLASGGGFEGPNDVGSRAY